MTAIWRTAGLLATCMVVASCEFPSGLSNPFSRGSAGGSTTAATEVAEAEAEAAAEAGADTEVAASGNPAPASTSSGPTPPSSPILAASASPGALRPAARIPEGDPMFPRFEAFAAEHLPANRCASDEIIRADQLVRLRTEMMVVGLSCSRFYPGTDRIGLFNQYTTFTVNHQARIREVQNLLGQFINAQRSGSAARLFDEYATNVANDESEMMNEVSTRNYCLARQTQFERVTHFNQAQLNQHLTQAIALNRGAYNSCSTPTRAEAEAGEAG